MGTKIQNSVSSDLSDIEKCNDEVDPRVQVRILIILRQFSALADQCRKLICFNI